MSTSGPNGNEDGWMDPGENRSPPERAGKRRRTDSYRDDENQETGLMRDGDSPGLPRFVGSSSGIHFVRAVYDILARNSGQPSRAHSQLVPGEDDQLDGTRGLGCGAVESPGAAAHARFWRDDEATSRGGGGAGGSRLTFEELIQWSQSYFDVWHPAFPFLHGPEVLETLERVADNGIEGVPGSDAAIVRSIISISLADARQLPRSNTPAVPPDLLFLNLDHVASCVSFVLGSPASLKNLQAALAVELFLISILKFNMASRLGGVVVRMAYHLGLHRCPQRYSNFGTHEVMMRKRIWWSFYCLERLICQALGLPLDVQDDDVDVCLPTTELHRNAADARTPDRSAPEGTSQLQLLALLSKHAQLRGMILELRHKSLHVREDSIDRALDVQARLTKWSNEVHDTAMGYDIDDARISAGNSNTEPTGDDHFQHYQTLLLILHHESTIALNRPLLAKKPPTPASQAALQACIQASRVIIETVYERGLGLQPAKAVDAAARPVIVWPLLTWSVWMSCFILTYAAFEGVTSTASALNYANRTSRILWGLSKRGTAWPSSCAHAVEQLISALEKRKSDANKVGTKQRSLLHNTTPTASRAARSRHLTANETVSNGGTQSWPGGITNVASETTTPHPQPGYTSYTVMSQTSPRPEDVNLMSTSHGAAQHVTAGQPRDETTPMSYLTPQYNDLTTTLGDEGWFLDPFSALDFSNFAQAGSSESAMSFNFY